MASAPGTVPSVTLSPLGRRSVLAAARVHSRPPAAASATAARSPSHPAARKRGQAGDPRREPRTLRPAAAPPRKGGAAHRSPGMRLQGAAEAAPRAQSTRAAILSGASPPTARGAADAAAASATPPPAARASRLLPGGAPPLGGAGRE